MFFYLGVRASGVRTLAPAQLVGVGVGFERGPGVLEMRGSVVIRLRPA